MTLEQKKIAFIREVAEHADMDGIAAMAEAIMGICDMGTAAEIDACRAAYVQAGIL